MDTTEDQALAAINDPDRIRALLENGANVFMFRLDRVKRADVLEILLAAGADGQTDFFYDIPTFWWWNRYLSPEMVQVYVKHGFDFNHKGDHEYGTNPMSFASMAHGYRADTIVALYHAGARSSYVDSYYNKEAFMRIGLWPLEHDSDIGVRLSGLRAALSPHVPSELEKMCADFLCLRSDLTYPDAIDV